MAFSRILEYDNTIVPDYFDVVIGHIEDIIICEQFQSMIHNFMEQHWSKFDSSDENKIEYTNIFNLYTNCIENFIITELTKRIENFNIELFSEQLQQKKSTLGDGEIFDLLLSFSDFLVFKDMMLDFKASKEGNFNNLSDGMIIISSLQEDFDVDEDGSR